VVSSSVSFSVSAQVATQSPELTADAAQGRHLFQMNCAHCHGDDARGDEGPDLHNLHKSDAPIRQVITAGIKGEMPSFGKKLGKPKLQQLTAYLQTLQG
jgi:mono/diheme cytochrome c family protein